MQPTSLIWKMLEFYGTRINHRGKWRVHPFLRSMLRANSDCDLEVTRQGKRWCLNPSDFVQSHLYWTAEYESWDVMQLSRWVHPGAVVFDIGANFGYYSVSLASEMRGSGKVYAFEPCKTTFGRLQTNIALNHLESIIEAIPRGLSERSGLAYLDRIDGNSGATALSSQAKGEAIELETLDHFCDANEIHRVDVVKIDVEGSELRVIEGGRAMLSRHQPTIMVEFNSSAMGAAGISDGQLEDLLRTLGYELFATKREQLLPFHSDPRRPTLRNVFCIASNRGIVIDNAERDNTRQASMQDARISAPRQIR
jgi:FkbM family methyltransferase